MDTLRTGSVGDAREALARTSELARAKRGELQLMVGGAYHELIDSADAIVARDRDSPSAKPATAPPRGATGQQPPRRRATPSVTSAGRPRPLDAIAGREGDRR